MRIDVITIFPEMFESPLKVSLLGKALESEILRVDVHDLRDWGEGPHRKVDDEPFGGGAGMVMAPGPIVSAAESVAKPGARIVLFSARGHPLTQAKVTQLAASEQVVLVCGRYEGVDERVGRVLGAEEISVGEFVLAGGEVAALMIIEAVARITSGVIGNEESLREESFTRGPLEYPQYTRPSEFRGLSVPEVLLSGDHAKIAGWRREQALRRTLDARPSLLETAELTDEEREALSRWREERKG